MKKFLVTGGCGFVGSHMTEKLVENGDSVTIIDDFTTGKKENISKMLDDVELIQGDIRDCDLIKKNMKNKDGVFHFAAKASVPESFQEPDEYYDVNVKGTQNIFQNALEQRIKVVYASSSSVYGNQLIIPIKENASFNPINPYAKTKVDCEKLAVEYAQKKLEVIGMRFFNIFGERQSMNYAGVITLFLDRIKKNLPPKINGNGSQIRDFVFVKDVIDANFMAMHSNVSNGFFNVGTGNQTSILELAEMIIKISKLDVRPKFCEPLKGDIEESIADVELINEKIGWKSKISLKKWLMTKI
jgi:UDP-glucose 4-epimerase